MRFRLGLVIGFGAGYYLGTAAGRERYEDINRTLRKFKRTDVYETASDKAKAVVDLSKERAKDVVDQRIDQVTERVTDTVNDLSDKATDTVNDLSDKASPGNGTSTGTGTGGTPDKTWPDKMDPIV